MSETKQRIMTVKHMTLNEEMPATDFKKSLESWDAFINALSYVLYRRQSFCGKVYGPPNDSKLLTGMSVFEQFAVTLDVRKNHLLSVECL